MDSPMMPDEPHHPRSHDVLVNLLESIAMEEIAISHLLSAEAKKIQAFVGSELDFPTHPSNAEIFQFNKETARVIESIVMKEWLLLRRFQNIMDFFPDEFSSHDSTPSSPCIDPPPV